MTRKYSNTAQEATLVGGITASATSMDVSGTSGFPTISPGDTYTLVIDPDVTGEELVEVTNVSGTTLTITRGADGTPASAHDSGAVVRHVHSAQDFRESREHEVTTSGVHGVTGSVVGTSDTQTLTNKTLSVDTNTINGLAASSFVLTDAAGEVDGAVAQKAIPSGAVVGTTDTQTLTNKDLTATTNDFPVGAEEDIAVGKSSTVTSLSVAEKVILSLSLSIPAHWSTYTVTYGFSFVVLGVSPTAVRQSTSRVLLGSSSATAVDGTNMSPSPSHIVGNNVGSGGSDSRDTIALAGGRAGSTGTGTQRVNATLALATTDSYSVETISGWARAVRTS